MGNVSVSRLGEIPTALLQGMHAAWNRASSLPPLVLTVNQLAVGCLASFLFIAVGVFVKRTIESWNKDHPSTSSTDGENLNEPSDNTQQQILKAQDLVTEQLPEIPLTHTTATTDLQGQLDASRKQNEELSAQLQQAQEEKEKTNAFCKERLVALTKKLGALEEKTHAKNLSKNLAALDLAVRSSIQEIRPLFLESPKTITVEQCIAEFEVVSAETSHADQMQQYIDEYCQGYDLATGMKFVREGYALIQAIARNDTAQFPKEKRKEHVVSLLWYMTFCAACRNQTFDQGMIVFYDPDHKIVKFLLSGGKEVAYPRASSHFRGRILPSTFEGKEMTTTYGIDIPPNEHSVLPGAKRTINFAPLKAYDESNNWSFIKPEDWGLSGGEFFMHALDYIRTRPAHLFGNPNGHNDRKEHVSSGIKKEFEALYREATGATNLSDDVKTFGIAAMKRACDSMQIDTSISTEAKEKVKVFLDTLNSQSDHINERMGNEFVLGESFLFNSALGSFKEVF